MAAEGGREEAMLYASAYATLLTSVAIVFQRDSAINEDSRPLVAAGLEAHGFRIEAEAALTLTIDTNVTAISGGQAPLAVQSRASPGDVDSLSFNLQVLPRRLCGRPSRRRYRVDLSLGEAGADRLWNATAIAHVSGSRAFSLAEQLVESLLDRLGDNATGERLALD
jgi:hypothetical protein